jgi:hypothetical protein
MSCSSDSSWRGREAALGATDAMLAPAGNYMTGPEQAARKVTLRPGGWEAWHEGAAHAVAE